MVDIDSETLFNGAAAIIATIAVVFFISNVQFDYSPVSKFLIVLVFIAGVFAVTQSTQEYQLTLFGYGVVIVSAIALFFDVVNTFGLGEMLTVLGLLGIAGLLFYVRTRLDEDSRFVTPTQAKYAFAGIAALAVAILLVDVVTGGLTYELQSQTEIEVPDSRDDEIQIASVVATNPTPLPERVEIPNYGVCTAGNWSEYSQSSEQGEPKHDVHVDVHVQDGYNEHVFGYGTKTYPVRLHLNGANLQGETFPVQTTSACPDEETGSPYIALFEGSENYADARPV